MTFLHSTLLLVTAAVSVWLGLFVFWRHRTTATNQSWMVLTLGLGAWSVGSALMLLAPARMPALWWARLAHVGAALIPIAFLRFTLALIDGPSPGRRLMTGSRVVAGLLGALALTPWLVADVQPKWGFRFYMVPGPLYAAFLLISAGYFLYTVWVLWREFRHQLGARRQQAKYVLVASLLGFGCYSTAYPLVYGVQIPPIGSLLILFYCLMAYAVLRWRLMDLRVAVKNTLLYATLYSVVVGLFVMVVVFLGQWLFYGPQSLDRRVLWMCMIALSVVVATLRPLDSWLRRVTDRFFFQRAHDYQRTLEAASRGMARVASLEHLLQLMAHFVSRHLRATHVAILFHGSETFHVRVARGRHKLDPRIQLTPENPLVAWLHEKKEVLLADEVERWLQEERAAPRRTVLRKTLEEIWAEMARLRARVCVPTFGRGRLLGLLVLGDKLSGDRYTEEDTDLLATLSNEAAVAIENANLYEQLYQRMQEIQGLYDKEHRMFIHTAIALAAAVDARDPYTHGHTERCTAYAMAIADEMGDHPEMHVSPRFAESLRMAALLHDVGKIGVPDHILNKKGKLTVKEFKKMQDHTVIGAVILQPIRGLEGVAAAVKAHQERFDGKGYPDRLRGREIPLMARIIAVADTFDAMTTDRPYRARLADDVAIQEITACSGTQFDPVVVEAFLRAYRLGQVVNRPAEACQMLRA